MAADASIERFRWWHIDAALPIEQDLFGVERWTAAMFWNELATGQHYLAALENGELIGYAGLALPPSSPEAWVNNLAVRRDRQRSGLGRRLLTALLDHARAGGAQRVMLEVAADNGPAQKLYDSYGFDVVGVRRGYYQPSNTDALIMRRNEP
jgi:[ribosomal protein S18]-alanine N-acetyltransferase